MAAITSNQSGAWSNTATWVGGVVPQDNGTDTPTIAAGHNVLMDVDQSAWSNGCNGVVITSHATTPGMLYWANGTNGYLKLKTGTTIAGTNAATRGRLLINSDGVWTNTTTGLQASNTAKIDLQTTAKITAQYLECRLLGTDPTVKTLRTYGDTFTFTYSGSGNTIVTSASTAWTAGANGTPCRVYTTGTLPTGLTNGTQYYVKTISTVNITLTDTVNGTEIALSGATSGTLYITRGILAVSSIASNIITLPQACAYVPIANAAVVYFRSSGTYPTGIEANKPYIAQTISGATFKIAGVNSGVAVTLGTTWTGTLEVYVGSATLSTPCLAVLDDGASDSTGYWAAGAYCFLANATSSGSPDTQRFRINAITPGVITMGYSGSNLSSYATLYNLLAAKQPNSRIGLASRNVEVFTNNTASHNLLDYTSTTLPNNGYFCCAFYNTLAAGGTYYGTAITAGGTTSTTAASGGGHTISGGAYMSFATTLSALVAPTFTGGVFLGGTYWSNGSHYSNISGVTVMGSTNGWYLGYHTRFNSGEFFGNVYCLYNNAYMQISGGTWTGLYTLTVNTSAVLISGGTFYLTSYVLSGGSGHRITGGTFFGLNYAVYTASNTTVTGGTFQYNDTICGYANFNIIGGTFQYNRYIAAYPIQGRFGGGALGSNQSSADFHLGPLYSMSYEGCYGADLRSSNTVFPYTYLQTNTYQPPDSPSGVFLFDVRDSSGVIQPGYIKTWSLGGIIASRAWSNGTDGATGLSPEAAIVHVCTFEDNSADNYVDIPIYGTSGQQITVNIATKASTTSNWITAPHMAIVDPAIGFKLSDELAATSLFSIADTNWHTYTLTYTPTSMRPLKLRIVGRGGAADGTGTGTMRIAYNLTTASSGGGCIPRARNPFMV